MPAARPAQEIDPYAPPGARDLEDRGALEGDDLARWRARVRLGATLVFASELGRGVLWRLCVAATTYYSLAADPAEHLQGGTVGLVRAAAQPLAVLVKLVGAAGVVAGVFFSTARPPRPVGGTSALRVIARGLSVLALAGHAARWVLVLGSSTGAGALEPATNLMDALAIAACACAVAPLFRAGGRPGAVATVGFALGYLFMVALRVGFWGEGGQVERVAWSTTMLTLGVLTAVLLSRLRRLLA